MEVILLKTCSNRNYELEVYCRMERLLVVGLDCPQLTFVQGLFLDIAKHPRLMLRRKVSLGQLTSVASLDNIHTVH